MDFGREVNYAITNFPVFMTNPNTEQIPLSF